MGIIVELEKQKSICPDVPWNKAVFQNVWKLPGKYLSFYPFQTKLWAYIFLFKSLSAFPENCEGLGDLMFIISIWHHSTAYMIETSFSVALYLRYAFYILYWFYILSILNYWSTLKRNVRKTVNLLLPQ